MQAVVAALVTIPEPLVLAGQVVVVMVAQLAPVLLALQILEAVVAVAAIQEVAHLELAGPAVQELSSSRFQIPVLQPFQAVLHPRYQLRYQDLKFTP
jgi:hypothetical protein